MRLKRSYVAVLAVFTLFIAGCSNNLVGRMSGEGNGENTVTFSVTNLPPDYVAMIREAQNPTARSILPNAPFDFASSPALTFKLSGSSENGESFSDEAISTLTGSGANSRTFTHTLSAHVWKLELTAYFNSKPVLRGYCTVDLINGNNRAEFNMSTKGLKTPGTVKLSGHLKDDDGICSKYEIGIYDVITGNLVDTYDPDDGTGAQPTNAKEEHTISSPSAGNTPLYYGDTSHGGHTVTLNPGTYNLLMVFYKTGSTSTSFIPIGSYADTIVVNPGNALVQTIQPDPLDVLNKKPEKPTELRAYLVDKSEDREPGYFYTKLTWTPSPFVVNYELKLITYSDDGTGTGAEKMYGFKATEASVTDFVGSEIYHAGSLLYGSTGCELKLELGKVYDIEIQARNFVGTKGFASRIAEASGPAITGYTYFEAGGSPQKRINRRRIRYNLNGGMLKLDVTKADGTAGNEYKDQYIAYDSYTGTAKSFLHIDHCTGTPGHLTLPASGTSLVRGSTAHPPIIDFKKWINPGTGAEITELVPPSQPAEYKYKNAELAADYGYGLDGTITIPGQLNDLDRNKIKITYDKDGGMTHTAATPNTAGHLVIPKRTGPDVTFITVAFDGLSPSTPEYKDMECTAYFTAGATAWSKVNFISAPDGKSCTFSTLQYPAQTFTLVVSAKDTSNNQRVSQTYIIDLQ